MRGGGFRVTASPLVADGTCHFDKSDRSIFINLARSSSQTFLLIAFSLMPLAPTSAVMPFFYLSLVWASILGFAIWGEVPTVSLVIGSAVVVASGLFLLWRETAARQLVAESSRE